MRFLLRMRRTWVIILIVAGFLVAALWDWLARPAGLDADGPYVIQFGRGSGMHGLDTVKIREDGSVTLHRLISTNDPSWETTGLKLRPDSLAHILDGIEKNRLFGLEKQYHGNVLDGTQWVLWIKQGDRTKAVYFDNNFPLAIKRFADTVDKALNESGLEKAAWRNAGDGRGHDKELWDSIR